MYFHLKLVIYSEYMKFLRMLLPNYKNQCRIHYNRDLSIEVVNRQVNHKSIEIYVDVYICGRERANKGHSY